MQCLEVSGVVRPLKGSSGVKGLKDTFDVMFHRNDITVSHKMQIYRKEEGNQQVML
jgi:hypothetical protein